MILDAHYLVDPARAVEPARGAAVLSQDELSGPGTEAVVAVIAHPSEADTLRLLQWADNRAAVAAVVGWAQLLSPMVGHVLDDLARHSRFRGVRWGLGAQAEDRALLRPEFNRGVAMLKEIGLRCDLGLHPHQWGQAAAFVDLHPQQAFILDPLEARTPIDAIESWQGDFIELARRDNVYCKLSGGRDDPRYFDTALKAFGPDRLMAGSGGADIAAAGDAGSWVHPLRQWARALSPAEQDRLFRGTAAEAYCLPQSCEH